MLNALIRLVERNKLLAAAWALFASTSLWLAHEFQTGDEQLAAFRSAAVKVSQSQAELRRVEDAIRQHDAVERALAQNSERLSAELDGQTPQVMLDQAVVRYRAQLTTIRAERASLESFYVETPALKELVGNLAKDFAQMDEFTAQRLAAMRLIPTDREAAFKAYEALRDNQDGERYSQEIAARDRVTSQLFDLARERHNAEVATYNAARRSDRLRGYARIAGWSYVGAFLGGFSVLVGSHWRRRLQRSDSGTAAPPLNPPTETKQD